ncbi:DUF4974 domain-containing protein [Pseudoflavitalea sp. G-6-1-2]|uniref:FecR family protein n=1 Tax=Pseudoflavitalea sp. G-6-1-2 TaxID=2728841 RepID=UPI00146EE132|nr:FecR family protein [Pseudoflavitalea sp. G-6-1-2]NML22276.1 DUF4974 domain-containing protein [Pseudoflavitalea sp. G-6-1-2]
MASNPSIEALLIKQLDQPLTMSEQAIVNQWLEASPANSALYESFQDRELLEKKLSAFNQFDEVASWEKLVASGRWTPEQESKTVYSIMRKRWHYAAAIFILCIGAGIFYLYLQSDSAATANKPELVTTPTEILPGKNQAILTVGDSTILLSDNKSGIVAEDNAIEYNDGERIAQAGRMITLSTPRGGQYQAVLPDGTKVWLNAASSIIFPSGFNKERAVKVSGEVYFEVAQNHRAPFMVTAGNTQVQVLGTSFNINAYEEERAVRTTLVDGSVRVLPLSENQRNVVLKPLQQAVSAMSGEITGVFSPDIASILAWKRGFFSFDNADFETVMRQLERWYDIKVQYRGAVPTVKLMGELDRAIPLTDVLRYLSRLNIKFEKEGRTLTILP